jgi:septum formation protein
MSVTKSLVLASNSPRRAFLLRECGFDFAIQPTHTAEEFDLEMEVESVPLFLARKKAEAANTSVQANQLIITADTLVIFDGKILNKPQSHQEAVGMLQTLSGQTHKVITGVCLQTKQAIVELEETSWVTFHDLKLDDINNYVLNFKPMDKAGAYGAQECLPAHYNPCSGHEREFLERIKNPSILEKSKPHSTSIQPLVAIKEIAGSYFNVMGLPIAKLYDKIIGHR